MFGVKADDVLHALRPQLQCRAAGPGVGAEIRRFHQHGVVALLFLLQAGLLAFQTPPGVQFQQASARVWTPAHKIPPIAGRPIRCPPA